MATDLIAEAGETRPRPMTDDELDAAARYIRRHADDPALILTALDLPTQPEENR